MKYFIFRNNTIEPFFVGKDYSFSGYDDISFIPEEAESYIWFYQVPIKFNQGILVKEVSSFSEKLKWIYSQIGNEKNLIVFTIENLYSVQFTGKDYALKRAIAEYNKNLSEMADQYSNVKLIDFGSFVDKYTIDQLTDWKFYFISQIGLNPKLGRDFKKWWNRKLEGLALKRKKCLVLDLDNTLWGGILGEDGIQGIKIGGDYPGKAFLYFQEALAQLSKEGIILTICSKNNEQDVLDAWENNPYIVLKQNYISAYRINWQNKADNIKELSKELNIGLDSMVFIDDNPTERELVKQMLPMVEVPDYPTQPYELPLFFASIVEKYFQIYSITDEDKKKTEQYKANADRAKEQVKYTDFSEFLKSLDIHIEIEPINEFNLPRIAQMTQKTNQFNLTTHRYTDSELKNFVENGWKIWSISVSDKFGDSGTTGCIIINGNRIDSLLLSCRILGKGIEFAFLKSIILELRKIGVQSIVADYIPSTKNSQVSCFYDKCGFQITTASETKKEYILDMNNIDINIEDYYHIKIK